MTNAGNLIHRVITIADFQQVGNEMKCISTRIKSKTFEKRDPEPMTIERYWLKDAPITYQALEEEMKRTGVIDRNDKTWQLQHKGGAPDRFLRAFYNLFRDAHCLPVLEGTELMEAFNASFNTGLKHYRGFNGKDLSTEQEAELKIKFSVFGNVFTERNKKESTR